jgi:hypothetical protein
MFHMLYNSNAMRLHFKAHFTDKKIEAHRGEGFFYPVMWLVNGSVGI